MYGYHLSLNTMLIISESRSPDYAELSLTLARVTKCDPM